MRSLCNRLAPRTALLALLVGCLGAMHLETARAQVSSASTRRLLSEQFHASTRVSFARVGGASAERSAIERRLGARLAKPDYAVFVATTGARVDGYAVFDAERGQHELIDYAVFFDAAGVVTRVEVLEYREPYGEAIRGERFRRQFLGRRGSSGFRADHAIDVVSGATISSRSMCAGVQRAAVLVEALLARGVGARGAQ